MSSSGQTAEIQSIFGHLPLCRDFQKAVQEASVGETLICLEGVCANRRLDADILELVRSKGLHVLLEMPEGVARHPLDTCHRCVSLREFPGLAKGTILAPHVVPVADFELKGEPFLVAARVAGYDTLAFGLPEETRTVVGVHEACPGLVVSIVPLSNFLRGRYAPVQRWVALWNGILAFMGIKVRLPENLRPLVDTAFSSQEELPPGALAECKERGFRMMEESFLYKDDKGVTRVAEGFVSAIQEDGSQEWRKTERSDCVIETAAAFGIKGILEDNAAYRELSEEIIGRMLTEPGHVDLNVKSPCAYQFTFYSGWPIFYSSGNSLTATLMAALQKNAPDPSARARFILRTMLSLLRSTGHLGQRRSDFRIPESFSEHNWDYFAREDFSYDCPHRQAALWTMFALGWKLTRHRPFLELADKGIEHLMAAYPRIKWTNDYTAELAKMLRPLSFLYRAAPGEKYLHWLEDACRWLLDFMEECGAFRSSVGEVEDGLYPPPASNDEYGSREASIIQKNDDPCCDFLYTQPFALAGLHEAFIATGKAEYRTARDKAAELFVRTQIRSTAQPRLNGAWLRAFDYQKWEYWGSSSDGLWGAWGVESGWTNAPVCMLLSLIEAEKGLYDMMPEDGAYAPFLQEALDELSTVYPLTDTTPNGLRGEIIGLEETM